MQLSTEKFREIKAIPILDSRTIPEILKEIPGLDPLTDERLYEIAEDDLEMLCDHEGCRFIQVAAYN